MDQNYTKWSSVASVCHLYRGNSPASTVTSEYGHEIGIASCPSCLTHANDKMILGECFDKETSELKAREMSCGFLWCGY